MPIGVEQDQSVQSSQDHSSYHGNLQALLDVSAG